MFISGKKYSRLLFRLSEIEKAIEEHDGNFFAMSQSIDELTDKMSGRIEALESEAGAVSEERKKEKEFFDGFSNIMNYEVPYGRKKE